MGCDGGTIPKRCELVREKKKPEKIDKEIELNAKWYHCAISQEELREPIVSCELGNLYRKESVLEYLLDKSKASTDVARHIRSLKDVKELVLTKKNGKVMDGKVKVADVYLDFQASDYICPIAGLEMNGRYRFCFFWKCGCVFSERGLKEVPCSDCYTCGKPFSGEDIVIINGNEQDVEKLRERMQERRQKAKQEKKVKKLKRAAVDNEKEVVCGAKKLRVDTSDGQLPTACGSTSVLESKVKGTKLKSSTGTSRETSTKSTSRESNTKGTSRETSTKSTSRESNTKGTSRETSTKGTSRETSTKGTSRETSTKTKASSSTQGSDDTPTYTKYKSVAENPDASKVFKSLFRSGQKGKPKPVQSNWVTYQSYHC